MNSRFANLLVLVLCGFYSLLSYAEDLSEKVLSSKQQIQEGNKPEAPNYTRSVANYSLPDVVMVDRMGHAISLSETIDYGGPILLQFIFATCSTVCPILSASFSVAQPELDKLSNGNFRLLSISIDPEQDRPDKLTEYAERFKAGKNWYFLTGKQADVEKILKAFDASYAGNNKMFHQSLTFMRRKAGDNWIRLEGLLGKNAIIEEYKNLLRSPSPAD